MLQEGLGIKWTGLLLPFEDTKLRLIYNFADGFFAAFDLVCAGTSCGEVIGEVRLIEMPDGCYKAGF